MASIEEIQRFLRQKRATGRYQPHEIESAYKAHFGAESAQATNRAQIDLQAKRDAEAKRQAAFRESAALREEERLEEANKLKGKLQIAKIAMPDLFMYEGGGTAGAQTGTSQAYSSDGAKETGVSREALDQGISEQSASEQAAPSANQRGWSGFMSDMQSGFGQAYSGRAKDVAGTAKQNTMAAIFGKEAVLAGLVGRAAREVGEFAWGGFKSVYQNFLSKEEEQAIVNEESFNFTTAGTGAYGRAYGGAFAGMGTGGDSVSGYSGDPGGGYGGGFAGGGYGI